MHLRTNRGGADPGVDVRSPPTLEPHQSEVRGAQPQSVGTNQRRPTMEKLVAEALAERKFHCLRKGRNGPPDEAAQLLLVDCIKTYLTLRQAEEKKVEMMAQTNRRPDVLEALSKPTWGERLQQEAMREGIREGRLQGERRALLRVLRGRFGDQAPPEPVVMQMAASVEELEDLIAKAATATSPVELGLPPTVRRKKRNAKREP